MTQKQNTITLNGENLSIEDIVAIGVGDKKVNLDTIALERCKKSRAFLEEEVSRERIIYGVNTSFGPMCNKIIQFDDIEQLQINLIKGHSAGLGAPLKHYIAIGVLAVRLNSLVKGYSGVRHELLFILRDMINFGIAPYIPENGSVGASGDLTHLAHVGLNIIGEGKVFYKNQLRKTKDVFEEVGLTALKPSFKEGLAIMNGTSVMSAIAAFALFGAKKLLRLACINAGYAIEIFGGIDDAFDEDLHQLKPHSGQNAIAATIRKLYEGSQNITLRETFHEKISKQRTDQPVYETDINVQDVYSIRCTPQILAPVYEIIESASKTIETEINSCNDNPLVVPDKKKIIHGGNFHGESVSMAMDMLSIAISKLSTLSERRLNKLLDNRLNEYLPEYLIPGQVGLTMGFMGAQYVATSTTAENRHLANPVSVHSISCNSSNQDVVSMGTISARKALKIVSNAKHILTVETMADLQAISFKNEKTMGKALTKIHRVLSENFKIYDNSEAFHDQLSEFRKILFTSSILDSLDPYFMTSS